MAENTHENMHMSRQKKWIWLFGSLVILLVLVFIVWISLPMLAEAGLQYEWSREVALDYLKCLGPRAAGALFRKHSHIDEEEWSHIVSDLINSSNNNKDASLFISSLNEIDAKGYHGKTPLHWAVRLNNYELAERLIEHGANVNDYYGEGWSVLHEAVAGGNLNIVRLLIRNRVDVNGQFLVKWTPLHHAIDNDRVAVAKILIDSGADIQAIDNDQFAPLHLAALRDHYGIARLLVIKGANVNAKAIGGRTPLHLAAKNCIKSIVQLLIKNGANVNARCIWGPASITPLDVAQEYSCGSDDAKKSIADTIRKHGGKTGKELDAEKATSRPTGSVK